jgi:hypothetical protein
MFFGRVPAIENWERVEPTEFDNALGITDNLLPDGVLVAGSERIHVRGGHGSTYVASALVEPEFAPSLQRALQAAKNPTDWKLPEEGEEECELEHGVFRLRGWLRRSRHERESLDDLDPYAEGIRWGGTMPGDDFCTRIGCIADATGETLRDDERRPIAWTKRWSDEDRDDREYLHQVRSSGERTFVDKGTLLKYLAETRMELIMEVQIGRHRDRSANSDEYASPTSRVYRLDSSGTVHKF